MIPLTPSDQLFLWLEKHHQPMHVGGLELFSFPEEAPENYLTQLAQQLRQHIHISPPFNRRLGSRLGQPVWEQDPNPDLEYHVRFQTLPAPGRSHQLQEFISKEHARPMNRERPLWECHLIDLPGQRQFVLYIKVHHALMDGVSAMAMFRNMLSTDRSRRHMPPVWDIPAHGGQSQAQSPESLWHSISHLLDISGTQLGTLPAVARELLNTISASLHSPEYSSLFRAPESILNRKISSSRCFSASTCDLSRIRRIGKAFGATVNDVVLAMCAGALRTYLMDQKALPEQSLVAMVPVSLHHDGDSEGNQVGVLLASLGTHLSDPVERLMHIHEDIVRGKERYRKMTPEAIINYTALMLAPAAFHLLTGMAPHWQTFNLVISNVPGPVTTCYWNGAKLETMYPASIAMDHMGLNMTLTSYNNRIQFGLIGCSRTLPGIRSLPDYLEDSLAALEQAL